jgi:hypothetical protein
LDHTYDGKKLIGELTEKGVRYEEELRQIREGVDAIKAGGRKLLETMKRMNREITTKLKTSQEE